MNKIVFIAFTPYHVKVSNYLAKTKFPNSKKRIIITPFRYASKESLLSIIQKKYYDDVILHEFNYSTKDVIKNMYSNMKKAVNELCIFEGDVINYRPDILIYFNDQPIPYQHVMRKIKTNKNLKCKLMFVEEGLGMYLDNEKFNFKNYIILKVKK